MRHCYIRPFIYIFGVKDVFMSWVFIGYDWSPAPGCYLNLATAIYIFTPEIMGDSSMILFVSLLNIKMHTFLQTLSATGWKVILKSMIVVYHLHLKKVIIINLMTMVHEILKINKVNERFSTDNGQLLISEYGSPKETKLWNTKKDKIP